jgi:ATP-dependent Clp protease ATP-binding subunit ClpC
MFERYTEKARKTIFYAGIEARELGAASIETEHLLLGLLRADTALTNILLEPEERVEDIRARIHAATAGNQPLPTSVDTPMSEECKRVLTNAADQADRLGHSGIGAEHLLLALIEEKGSLAASVLTEHGMTIEQARELVRQSPSA